MISHSKAKKPANLHLRAFVFFGSPTWTRTRDLRINRAFYTGDSIPAYAGVYTSLLYDSSGRWSLPRKPSPLKRGKQLLSWLALAGYKKSNIART